MNLFNRHNVYIKTAYEKYADLLYRVALSHLANGVEANHIEAADEHSGSEVMQLLSKVPDKYKDTLVLHCLEGYSQEETAMLLKISLSAVKMRIKRGREILMKIRQEEKDVY